MWPCNLFIPCNPLTLVYPYGTLRTIFDRVLEDAKKRKDWVPGNSNTAEQFLRKAGYILTNQRKKILPMNFEGQIFLYANKTFWNLATVNEICEYAKIFVCVIHFFPLAIFEQYIFENITRNSKKNIFIFPKKIIIKHIYLHPWC